MNRQILRTALSDGGELMRGLYGPPEPTGTYRADPRSGEKESTGGLLIDRQA